MSYIFIYLSLANPITIQSTRDNNILNSGNNFICRHDRKRKKKNRDQAMRTTVSYHSHSISRCLFGPGSCFKFLYSPTPPLLTSGITFMLESPSRYYQSPHNRNPDLCEVGGVWGCRSEPPSSGELGQSDGRRME